MASPPLAPPPPDVVRREIVPAAPPPRASRRRAERPGDPYYRVLGWALFLSLLLHAGVLLLTGDLTIDPAERRARSAERSEPFSGLEWVLPVPEGAEGDSPPADAEVSPIESAPPEVPRVIRVRPGNPELEAATPPGAPPAAGGAPGGRGSARDALRPGYRDPRLYVDPNPLGVRGDSKSNHEKYMEHLQARIDAVNDSMGVAAAREKAAKDWTFRDKDGKRWGLSDEGLHLGPITIPNELVPIPRSTGDNQTREAGLEEQRQRDEIRRQEETRERRDTMQARAGATRQQRGGGGSGGGG